VLPSGGKEVEIIVEESGEQRYFMLCSVGFFPVVAGPRGTSSLAWIFHESGCRGLGFFFGLALLLHT
jgi:hypothetical protein